jgi:uncharacterized protein YdhG (YjbR/CyaY superfamily)
MDKTTHWSIDEYIASQSPEAQNILRKIRETVKKAAPEAEEAISYSMPAFKLGGILVYFAAFKNHIGFFPTARGIANFAPELSGFQTSKGTIRFPLNKPVPYDLIFRITQFRVNELKLKKKKK